MAGEGEDRGRLGVNQKGLQLTSEQMAMRKVHGE
jgi:hypothetical protein